ncbi:hypothetical protein RZZ32_004959, partial [Escherichia coli]|nr:hypothetical protein [Escherichia coli]
VFGAQGMNVALKDAMLCWGEDEDKPEVDPFAALEDALSLAAMCVVTGKSSSQGSSVS